MPRTLPDRGRVPDAFRVAVLLLIVATIAGFAPGWRSGGGVRLVIAAAWMDRFAFGAEPDAPLAVHLPALRSALPGPPETAVQRSRADRPQAWRPGSTESLALLAGVAAVLGLGWRCARRRIRRQPLAQDPPAGLLTAWEQLSRLRDPGEIITRAGAIGRILLPGARVELSLDVAAAPAPGEIVLPGAGGERLGRISAIRAGGAGLTGREILLLEQFAGAVGAALEGAALRADRKRSETEAELELILANVSDGILVVDRTWCVRSANAAAARWLHRQPADMPGADLWTLLPGLREGDIGERLEAACNQGHDAAFTGFCPRLNAWFEVRANTFAGGLIVYFRDVTIQWETEEKLHQVQRLETVGQLAGGVAHDVNNLLTVILGNLELLAMRAEDRLAGIADAEEDRRFDVTLAEAGVRAGDSASQLMHRLLAFSRRQSVAPEVVAVGDLLRSLQPLMRRTMSEQVSLRMHWPAGLWHVLVDQAELESAILNLSINAQDAMPGGGALTIEASNVEVDPVYAAGAGLDRIGDTVMISVADTGTGMPKDVMARAFDPFFTTKAPGKGTGLGLSMVSGFVRQSGGQVLIDSEPGQGAVVRIYLPRALPPEPAAPTVARTGAARGSESILLVEDNDLVRAHTEAMLRGLGYQVAAVADGPAAQRVLADGLRPDLLVTDVIMPGGLTGRDVAEAAQRSVAGLRVLFISGYSGDVLMENGRLPPGVDLLAKPFRRSDLAARVRAQLDA